MSRARGIMKKPGHTRYVTSHAVSCDGMTLASASGKRTVKLYQLPKGALRHPIPRRLEIRTIRAKYG
jgi:WD40 repeat protein